MLGSGWAPGGRRCSAPAADEFPLTDLAGFLPPAVAGHAGRLRSIQVGGKRVLAFLGRTHLYEGRGVEPVVHGVRVGRGRRLPDDRADQRLRRAASRHDRSATRC